jgi:hypothetical protein
MLQAGRSPVKVPDEVSFFNLPNPSRRSMALGSTQPLTKMSTGIFLGIKGVRRVWPKTLPSVCRISENVGASISRDPNGLHGLYMDNFTLPFTKILKPSLFLHAQRTTTVLFNYTKYRPTKLRRRTK